MPNRINTKRLLDNLPWLSLILLVIIFTSVNKNFLSVPSLKNIFSSASPLLVASIGVTFVLLIGSVDLSVGAVCSCACVIFGTTFPRFGNYSFLLAAGFGLAAGLVNGLVFAWLRIPSFIVTLSTLSLWKCVALLIVGGAPRGIPIRLWKGLAWSKLGFGFIPIFFGLSLLVLGLYYLLQSRTAFGRSVFAIGANERAARMFGLKVTATKIGVFVLSGIGGGLAGAIYCTQLKSSLPTIGDPLTLMAMAAVALGGTPLTGGKGSVLKTLLGALLVLAIQNGLNIIAVDAFWQQIVFGSLMIFALYLNSEKGGRYLIVK